MNVIEKLKDLIFPFGWKTSIIIFYVLSRIVLHLTGIQFIVEYKFMVFHSLDLLKENFFESILYTHSFTVFMNIIAGTALKLPVSLQPLFYKLIFYLSSIVLLISFGRILEFFKVHRHIIFIVLAFFCCIPPFIYFENLLLYTQISCCLLTLSIAVLIKAFQINSFRLWFTFFSICALLSFIRTSYHIIWLIATLVLVIVIDFKSISVKLKSFVLPFSFIFLWYFKNLILFGFFGASSMFGLNLSLITVKTLSQKEKRTLVNSGKMSSVSLPSIFAGIDKYKKHIEYDLNEKTGIAVLDEQFKSQGFPNFNHSGFIEVSEKRMKDNLTYLKLYPERYLKNVFQDNVKDFLRPSTKWHPSEHFKQKGKKSKSLHIPNRKIIGKWEEMHNNLVHYLIFKPIGLYALTLINFFYYTFTILYKFVITKFLLLREKILLVIIFNIFYLAAISCLFAATELERYRFIIEPLLWTITILFLISAFKNLTTLYQKQSAD